MSHCLSIEILIFSVDFDELGYAALLLAEPHDSGACPCENTPFTSSASAESKRTKEAPESVPLHMG